MEQMAMDKSIPFLRQGQQARSLSPSFLANEKRTSQPPQRGIWCTLIGNSSVARPHGLAPFMRHCAPPLQSDRRPISRAPGGGVP
jgi:hypothetical protein